MKVFFARVEFSFHFDMFDRLLSLAVQKTATTQNSSRATHSVQRSAVKIARCRATFTTAELSSRGLRGFGTIEMANVPTNGTRFTMSGWVENTAEVTVPVPLPIVWELWQDKSRIPNWMPWISSVESLEDEMSRWTLSADQFGRHFEFSWVARDLTPIKQQKIHWTSEEGLRNRGAVNFFEEQTGVATRVQIQISYEVPDVLFPFGSALSPLVDQILKADLERFSVFARKVQGVMKPWG